MGTAHDHNAETLLAVMGAALADLIILPSAVRT